MILSDNSENSEIVILYVQHFKHLDPGTKEAYGGHPISKRVYRAIHNKDTDTYRVLYNLGERAVGVALPNLATADDHWDYHLIELHARNIVDYDILEEDLDKILGWGDNADIMKFLSEGRIRGVSGDPNGLAAFAAMIKAVEDDDLSGFRDLRQHSPLFFEALDDLAIFLMHGGQLSIENMNLSNDDTFGPGINIGGANQALYKYTTDHRRDPKDLLAAIEHLLAEYVRIT